MRRAVGLAATAALVAAPFALTPAAAETIVAKRKVERGIAKELRVQAGVRVRVKCPKRVTWKKGRVFHCKVRSRTGDRYRVRVKLSGRLKGLARWRVVA